MLKINNAEERMKKEIFDKVTKYYKEYASKFSKKGNFIQAAQKKYDEKELISAVDAVLDCWWTEGKKTKEFEEKFNKFLGIKNTIIVNSGSSANFLALKTLTSMKLGDKRILPGDEAITVAAGFPTTINPILDCNLVPVFCDVDIPTYNININSLKKAITKKTKVIFIAHTLGNPFNLKEVVNICKKNNIWLIEDNCDSLGSKYNGRFTGTFGDISTFSFYPAHHMTMGEGGALCTNNALLAKIARSIRDWGRDCWCGTGEDNSCKNRYGWKLGQLPEGYDHKYIYSEIGYNLKNTDLNVALGLAQIEKLQRFISSRKDNFKILKERLLKFNKYLILPESTQNSEPSWFGFPITLREDCNFKRESLLKYLNDNKIGTRLLFGGNITKQPYFIDYKIKYRIVNNLSNTDLIMNNTFWIGIHPLIGNEEIDIIYKAFESFFEK